jgi:putative MATE family efflux protein
MDTPSSRRVLSLALPMAGEHFLVFGILIFDTILAGQLGVEELSAQTVVTQWIQLTSVIFNITAVGGSILVAQAIGRSDKTRANHVLSSALILALLTGGITSSVIFAAGQFLFDVMAVEQVVNELGVPYLRLLALSIPLNFVLLSAVGCIRGTGDARTPLLIMGAANFVHVLLATILATGSGGAVELGLQGIAWASIISRGLGTLLVLGLLFKGIANLHLSWSTLDLKMIRSVLSVGNSVAGEQLAIRLGQLVNLRLVTGLGTVAVAAYSVVLNSLSLILILGLGFMTATLTIVGQQVGAGKEQEIHETGWRTLRLAWLVMGATALFFLVWPHVVRLFSNDPATLAQAVAGLGLVLWGIPFEAVNQVFTGGIRGAGDTRYPMLNTLFGHWFIRLPLILLLIGPLNFGLNGFWIAMVIEMLVRAILNIRRFRSEFWLYASQLGV